MQKIILGNKLAMTNMFDKQGNLVPVTIIKAGPCYITNLYTNSIQIGYVNPFGKKKITKPEYGHLIKNNNILVSNLKEFKIENISAFKLNTEINLSIFNPGDLITITGLSIGKGTTGNIKRHGFKRGPVSHGSKHHRLQGSLGAGTDPGRVFPGKKMAGHSGFKQSTLKNLEVIELDITKNLIAIKGCVPGKKGNLLILKK